jgi:hypothetical protein
MSIALKQVQAIAERLAKLYHCVMDLRAEV